MRACVCGFLSLLLVGCTSAHPLIVASDLSNRPFAFVEEEQPLGFEPELVTAIGVALGRPVQWERMDFGQLIEAVVAGKVDLACATMGITPERAERIAFSSPYYVTEISVVVLVTSPLQTIADLAGKRVGAGRGTTSERALKVHAPDARVVLERKEDVSFAMMLASGELEAAAMDGPDAQRMIAAEPSRYRRLGALSSERYALAVNQQDAELLQALNRVLAEMQSDGRLAAMLQQQAIPASAQ